MFMVMERNTTVAATRRLTNLLSLFLSLPSLVLLQLLARKKEKKIV